MPTTLPFACRCGKVTGRLTHVDPKVGTHVLCYCKSCRRAMEIAGLGEEAASGVEVYQTTPDRIEVETGMEHLVPRQFSPDKGIYRWHAACCDTPMFNTMKKPSPPFAGILTRNLADAGPLGPVIAEGFIPGENGKQTHKNAATLMWRFMKRAVRARFSGRHRTNPFFGADGKAVAAFNGNPAFFHPFLPSSGLTVLGLDPGTKDSRSGIAAKVCCRYGNVPSTPSSSGLSRGSGEVPQPHLYRFCAKMLRTGPNRLP